MPERGPNGDIVITPVDLWEKLEVVDRRISNLERFRYAAMGGGAVIGALFGTFGAYLTNYIINGR